MYQYYNNILCVEGGWLYRDAQVISKENYKKLSLRGWFNVVRRGCKGRPALVEWDSIPERFKTPIIEKFGDPKEQTKHITFEDYIKPDQAAIRFFDDYRLKDGRTLPIDVREEYSINASILNACHILSTDNAAMRRAMGGRVKNIWPQLALMVDRAKHKYGHSLPLNDRRLRERCKQYKKEGPGVLIHRNYCNDNSRKVSNLLENLILSLYVMPRKPYMTTVGDLYLQFLGGVLDVVDVKTGELFDRDLFHDKNGVPITLSESTIWNYIKNPKNRTIVESARNDFHYFNDRHRPHHHRHHSEYSLSKISMDDRDIPHKMADGNRVKAYYAYDVMSGVCIGAAYSRKKDKSLFVECMRSMFRFLHRYGLGIPAEVEVEHHLVNQFADDLMKAEVVFSFVRWCNPGNSQEKWAETGNRIKKYGYEKRYQEGIGRHTLSEANRPKQQKEWTEEGMQTKERVYTFEEIVANDREAIEAYNNDLHKRKKKFPGMSRIDVLLQQTNPGLKQYRPAVLARYIGEKTTTTIRRNQYVRVQYADYQLPNLDVLTHLEPNNYNVDAYYLPDTDGTIAEVHIYQDGNFIATCEKIATYNTATAEHTDADKENYQKQAKYVAQFDKLTKDGRANLAKVMVIENKKDTKLEPEEVEVVEMEPRALDDDFEINDDFNVDAIESL